jgi:hypothetical protein
MCSRRRCTGASTWYWLALMLAAVNGAAVAFLGLSIADGSASALAIAAMLFFLVVGNAAAAMVLVYWCRTARHDLHGTDAEDEAETATATPTQES